MYDFLLETIDMYSKIQNISRQTHFYNFIKMSASFFKIRQVFCKTNSNHFRCWFFLHLRIKRKNQNVRHENSSNRFECEATVRLYIDTLSYIVRNLCNKLQYQFCSTEFKMCNKWIYVLKIFIRFCGVFFMAGEKSVSEATISSLLQQTAKKTAHFVCCLHALFFLPWFVVFFFFKSKNEETLLSK